MNKISFIIPVYNCKYYLPACIESIEKIGYSNYEVILIDDGSTDGSEKICDSLSGKNSHIKCLHQENQGVSVARNRGLEQSTGEYVMFLDADDSIEPEELRGLIDLLENIGNIDMLIFGMSFDYYFHGKMYRRDNLTYFREGILEKEQWISGLGDLFQCNALSSVCNKLIRRKILVDYQLEFQSDVIDMEDFLFVIQCLTYCNQIYVSCDVVYRYRQTEDERSTFRRLKRINNLSTYMTPFEKNLQKLIIENIVSGEIAAEIKNIVVQIYLCFLHEFIHYGSISEIKKAVENMLAGNYADAVRRADPVLYCFAVSKKYFRIWMIGIKIRMRHWLAVRVKYVKNIGENK